MLQGKVFQADAKTLDGWLAIGWEENSSRKAGAARGRIRGEAPLISVFCFARDAPQNAPG